MSIHKLEPRQRLVFPLDAPDWESARDLVRILKDEVGFFKIGLELFVSHGPAAVSELKALTDGRAGVFLDLKLHDIPATVGRAMAAVSKLGADLVTVHACDGPGLIAAAKLHRESKKLLDRHDAMHANCTLTHSRYFNKYWPSDEWEQNIEAVRAYYDRPMTSAKGWRDEGNMHTYLNAHPMGVSIAHLRPHVNGNPQQC